MDTMTSTIYGACPARLTSEYKGRRFEGPEMGMTGLIYKDEDMFSFICFRTIVMKMV